MLVSRVPLLQSWAWLGCMQGVRCNDTPTIVAWMEMVTRVSALHCEAMRYLFLEHFCALGDHCIGRSPDGNMCTDGADGDELDACGGDLFKEFAVETEDLDAAGDDVHIPDMAGASTNSGEGSASCSEQISASPSTTSHSLSFRCTPLPFRCCVSME